MGRDIKREWLSDSLFSPGYILKPKELKLDILIFFDWKINFVCNVDDL